MSHQLVWTIIKHIFPLFLCCSLAPPSSNIIGWISLMRSIFLVTTIKVCMSSLIQTALDFFAQHLQLRAHSKPVTLPPPTSVCLSPDSPVRVQRYRELLMECQASKDTGAMCAVVHQTFLIDGKETRIGREIARGAQGKLYVTSDPQIVVKEQLHPDCEEIAAIKVLNGLDGFAPKLYGIRKDGCKTSHLLAMNKLGDSDWATVMSDPGNHVPLAHAYFRFSKLLLALKSLHYLGFGHNDLHEKNVRVIRTDPSKVFLIDFGFLSPFGEHTAASDLEKFFRLVFRFFSQRPSEFTMSLFDWIFDALVAETSDAIQCPNYDLWIWVFNELAKHPSERERIKDAVVAFLPQAYEEWKQARMAIAQRTGESVKLIYFPTSFSLPIPEAFINPPAPTNMYTEIAEMIREQAKSDSDYPETAPYLYYDGEVVKETSDSGIVSSRLILKSLRSEELANSVIRQMGGFIIEYRSNCDALDDPLFTMQREFGFMKLFAKFGLVTPVPVWLSPPVKLPIYKSHKLDFTISPEQYAACAADPRSQVRYMVTQRIFPIRSLSAQTITFSTFSSRIDMAISLISQLKQIHDQAIIYGSVNPDSIITLYQRDGGADKYGFSNFKRSLFVAEQDPAACGAEECPPVPIGLDTAPIRPCFKTHWEIDGSRPAYRDDVFNVLLLLAWTLNPSQPNNFCDSETIDSQQVKLWKSHAPIFETALFSDPGLPEGVRTHLESALAVARSVDAVDKMPNHEAIIHELTQALHLVRPLAAE